MRSAWLEVDGRTQLNGLWRLGRRRVGHIDQAALRRARLPSHRRVMVFDAVSATHATGEPVSLDIPQTAPGRPQAAEQPAAVQNLPASACIMREDPRPHSACDWLLAVVIARVLRIGSMRRSYEQGGRHPQRLVQTSGRYQRHKDRVARIGGYGTVSPSSAVGLLSATGQDGRLCELWRSCVQRGGNHGKSAGQRRTWSTRSSSCAPTSKSSFRPNKYYVALNKLDELLAAIRPLETSRRRPCRSRPRGKRLSLLRAAEPRAEPARTWSGIVQETVVEGDAARRRKASWIQGRDFRFDS